MGALFCGSVGIAAGSGVWRRSEGVPQKVCQFTVREPLKEEFDFGVRGSVESWVLVRAGRGVAGLYLVARRCVAAGMRDRLNRGIARHPVLFQKGDGRRVPLGKERQKHVSAPDLGGERAIILDGARTHDALESACRGHIARRKLDNHASDICIDMRDKRVPQPAKMHTAGLHDRSGVAFVDQREEQMLGRHQVVATGLGKIHAPVNGILQALGKYGHW
ncbi:MAG: hypothetical protein AAGH83_06760 [Pseudomonadota bacterium]